MLILPLRCLCLKVVLIELNQFQAAVVLYLVIGQIVGDVQHCVLSNAGNWRLSRHVVRNNGPDLFLCKARKTIRGQAELG